MENCEDSQVPLPVADKAEYNLDFLLNLATIHQPPLFFFKKINAIIQLQNYEIQKVGMNYLF